MRVLTLVFALVALASFIAYHVLNNISGKSAATAAHVAWFWVTPLGFVAAALSSAFE